MRGVLVALLFAVLAVPTPVTADELIKEFEGNGIQNTRPFTVDGPWEVQWSSVGEGLLVILILTKDDTSLNVAASQDVPGRGASFQPKGGEYYLSIIGAGSSWTVRVVRIE